MKVGSKVIKTLYMAHTTDKYELPIAVADSVTDLARMLKMKKETVQVYMSVGYPGFCKIDVSMED